MILISGVFPCIKPPPTKTRKILHLHAYQNLPCIFLFVLLGSKFVCILPESRDGGNTPSGVEVNPEGPVLAGLLDTLNLDSTSCSTFDDHHGHGDAFLRLLYKDWNIETTSWIQWRLGNQHVQKFISSNLLLKKFTKLNSVLKVSTCLLVSRLAGGQLDLPHMLWRQNNLHVSTCTGHSITRVQI